MTAAIAALNGLLCGYDTGVISGALLFIKRDFALSSLQQELVVSGVLGGAVVGAIVGGNLADRLGRRRLILVTRREAEPRGRTVEGQFSDGRGAGVCALSDLP